MRELDMTDPHVQQLTTLDDVMDLINSDLPECPSSSSSPLLLVPRGAPSLSTVTMAPWNSPPKATPPSCVLSVDSPPPSLRITEQPKQRGMRFRYQCEGRSAGSILGEHSTDQNKTLPSIEICHCEALPEVGVTVCLVWKDPPHRVHPHSLVGKDCHDGICEVTLQPREGETRHSFSNLGIQCVRKKEIEASVREKLRLNIDPFKAGLWRHHEEVDLNVVRLCFQASYTGPNGQKMLMKPVLSEPVYDKKSTNTSELRIYRMNKEYGKCSGGEELYILCDKVQKEDIQVVFFDGTWEARADFSQADVHRQIAIVLKTPPYRDLHIREPAQVFVCLHRITDSIRSEGITFTYLPKDSDDYQVQCKNKRHLSSLEEYGGHDPHGIEAKRSKRRPEFLSHCNSFPDFPLPVPDYYQEFVPSFSDAAGSEPQDIAESSFEFVPALVNDIFSLESYPDMNAPYGLFQDNEATADLVSSSLLLSEEKREFEPCAYTESKRGGNC
ncbi:transcription factor RelB isoform X2 [Bombina bombina]|uniref:transcription factor RelB isoform X2 n=1 Tax=Bombina bombina TaxID=8345 RepID=UPI00235AAE50|nr:transcription factor RelB isoform X2 [Bombina bombina]